MREREERRERPAAVVVEDPIPAIYVVSPGLCQGQRASP